MEVNQGLRVSPLAEACALGRGGGRDTDNYQRTSKLLRDGGGKVLYKHPDGRIQEDDRTFEYES